MNNLNLDTCSRGVKDVPAWRGKISIQSQLDECHPGSVFRLNRLKIRLLSPQHFSKINKSVSCLIVSAKIRLSRLLHLLLSVWRWNRSSRYTLWTNCLRLACFHHLLFGGVLLKGLLSLIKERVNGWMEAHSRTR